MDTAALSTGLALVGKAAVVSCFCCIFIYSNEIFPTVIRTVGVGACAFWGRVGSLLAPQILLAVSSHQRILSWFVSGGLTLWLTSYLSKQVNLLLIQHNQSSQIQTTKTVGQPNSNTKYGREPWSSGYG